MTVVVVRVIVVLESVTTVVVVLVVIGGQVSVVVLSSHPNGWVEQTEVEEDSDVSGAVVVVLPFEFAYLTY